MIARFQRSSTIAFCGTENVNLTLVFRPEALILYLISED
jgi:hypothetical protein